MKNIELLAPAGSLKKLKTAIDFGADAVYAGGKEFSLRAFADNFTIAELKEGADYCHERGKKLYVTVNIFPRNADFPVAKEYFKQLESIGVDAVLITDAGLLALCKEVAPHLPIHLSTQANNLNKYTIEFWKKQGVERVVLARELSFAEIKEISEHNPDIELEAFVHGAMCVSYSGRCLLSNYLDGRDANRGECVQACRWNYHITEASRHGSPLTMQEDERGTYILNSKDLNMIAYISELLKAGIVSLKIEGRMKSEYYLATIVNAYRRAIDAHLQGKLQDIIAELETEVRKVAHRDYTVAYALGNNSKTIAYNNDPNTGTHEFIAIVEDYENGYAKVEMRNRFKVGEIAEVLSTTANHNATFIIEEVLDERGNQIDDVKHVQQKVLVKTDLKLRAGDILRRKK